MYSIFAVLKYIAGKSCLARNVDFKMSAPRWLIYSNRAWKKHIHTQHVKLKSTVLPKVFLYIFRRSNHLFFSKYIQDILYTSSILYAKDESIINN